MYKSHTGCGGEIPDGILVPVSSLDRNIEKAFAMHSRFIADLKRAMPGSLGFEP